MGQWVVEVCKKTGRMADRKMSRKVRRCTGRYVQRREGWHKEEVRNSGNEEARERGRQRGRYVLWRQAVVGPAVRTCQLRLSLNYYFLSESRDLHCRSLTLGSTTLRVDSPRRRRVRHHRGHLRRGPSLPCRHTIVANFDHRWHRRCQSSHPVQSKVCRSTRRRRI